MPLVETGGGWTAWTAWSNCEPADACGSKAGTTRKTRQCQSEQANKCAGPTEMVQQCWQGPCPVDGGWSDWGEWSSTCSSESLVGGSTHQGTGQVEGPTDVDTTNVEGSTYEQIATNIPLCEREKFRLRECTNPEPGFGGQPCPDGGHNQTAPCSPYPCPVNGQWSEWSEWTPCPQMSCMQEADPQMTARSRRCNNPQPVYGGQDCVEDSDAANLVTSKVCDGIPFCPVDGGWSEWTQWSSCSATCENGIQSRGKTCDNPQPAHGGQQCQSQNPGTDSSMSEQRECAAQISTCPRKKCIIL